MFSQRVAAITNTRSFVIRPFEASPGKLPHLGRAFTDVQELKQVMETAETWFPKWSNLIE